MIYTASPHQSRKANPFWPTNNSPASLITRTEVKGYAHLMFDEKNHQFSPKYW